MIKNVGNISCHTISKPFKILREKSLCKESDYRDYEWSQKRGPLVNHNIYLNEDTREWYNNLDINFIIASKKINHLVLISDDQLLIFRTHYEFQKAIRRLQMITQNTI